MKKHFYGLAAGLLVSGILVMAAGAYLKYGPLRDIPLAREKSAVELPFALIADDGLRYVLRDAMTETAEEKPLASEEVLLEAWGDKVMPPTEPPTEPAPEETEPPLETVPPTQPPLEPVDLSWYDDALFIGDSRICGLRMYSRAGNARYFCSVGMNVFNYDDTDTADEDYPDMTLAEVLAERKYGKIFINLGLNESGYPIDAVMKAYEELLDVIRTAQPDAKIILQGIIMVSKIKSTENACFDPGNLRSMNERIAALADGETVFYIDANVVFVGEDGYLYPHLSGDGCHFYPEYAVDWAEWISLEAAKLGI